MIGRQIAILGALLLISACAAPERVILLPHESGGGSGGVVVLNQQGEQEALIEKPYAEARIGRSGKVKVRQTDAARVQETYGSLLEALPPPPSTFILYFEEGTTTLMPQSEPALEMLFTEVSVRSGADVQVVGHTDTVGRTESNDRLSLARAMEIRRSLIDRGLDPSLVRGVGRGERELLVDTADEVDEPRNRRVEVVVR